MIQILKRPTIIKNLVETFLYPVKDKGVKAELVVIAIKGKSQGRGLGKDLIKMLEKKFKQEKVNLYKLSVHADKKAVGFYKKLGFKKTGLFDLYGRQWFIYEKKIA